MVDPIYPDQPDALHELVLTLPILPTMRYLWRDLYSKQMFSDMENYLN